VSAPTVLVVEDEPSFVEALSIGLRREGFHVEVAMDGFEALERFDLVKPDLVLLDVMLPRISGIDVCRQLRKRSQVPIIMVTAKGAEIDTVVGLEVGADDYVVKPFGMAELLARARAAMRRHTRGTIGEPVVKAGPLAIDLARRVVSLDGSEVQLSPKEYRLLQVLAQHAGNVVTHQHLLKEVWGLTHVNDGHYLRILVRKIRSKIERDPTQPRLLTTELGVGYRLAQ
jgi:DNA-binding response OmpR family regulator